MSLLRVQDPWVKYHTSRGVVEALSGLNLSMEEGEVLGVVGESGSGKTRSASRSSGCCGEALRSKAPCSSTGRTSPSCPKWIEGALHEVAQNFRVVTVEEIAELYERKRNYKELEAKLGLV